MGLMILAHRPAAPLASYVEKLWYCDAYQGVHRTERVLPNGRFQLVISLAEGPLRAPGNPTEGAGSTGVIVGTGNTVALQRDSHGRAAIGNGCDFLAGRCSRFL
jgi:hypothetical protein